MVFSEGVGTIYVIMVFSEGVGTVCDDHIQRGWRYVVMYGSNRSNLRGLDMCFLKGYCS